MRSFILSIYVGALTAGAALAQSSLPTPIAPAQASPPAAPCLGAEGVAYFGLGAITLSADSDAALRGLANSRNAACKSRISIMGRTDRTGSVPHNQQLAQQRASAVQAQLISFGVPRDEIGRGGAAHMRATRH